MFRSNIGKLKTREILVEFDATLAELYGVGMVDLRIEKTEAISLFIYHGCPKKAAESVGIMRGLTKL